jgi:hypothetical protein
MEDLERKIYVCSCNSIEHQMSFFYDEKEKELYTEVHLYNYKNFFKRLISAIKYIFGYKSKYGNWDSMIFKKEDLIDLRNYLNKIEI